MNNKIKETITLDFLKEQKGKRLDIFINEILEDSTRSYVQKLISSDFIQINDTFPKKSGYKIKGNETIIINIPENEDLSLIPENIPLDIIYDDSHIAIVNKAPNMVVHPAYGNYSGTLVNSLLYHIRDLSGINGIIRPGIVHRLDKDTSGLIIIAKEDNAHVRLSQLFADKEVQKTYLAIANGIFKEKNGRIETLIGRDVRDRKKMRVVNKNGKNAITNYSILDENNNASFVAVNIETGRTHQIRVHLKYLHHSIIGDETYGSKNDRFQRQMLHAYKLVFNHPITNRKMEVCAPIPEDFKKCLKHFHLDTDKILNID